MEPADPAGRLLTLSERCLELRRVCLGRGITAEQISGRYSIEALTELSGGPSSADHPPLHSAVAEDVSEEPALAVLQMFDALSGGTGFLPKSELQRMLGTNFLARQYMKRMAGSMDGITREVRATPRSTLLVSHLVRSGGRTSRPLV